VTDRDRRNPYVMLGVPFGASDRDARSGFSRATRRLRQNHDAEYSQEDLTWALHQIEQLITHPEQAFGIYRIPAVKRDSDEAAHGVFNPAPHRTRRTTEPAGFSVWDLTRRRALEVALRRVMAEKLPTTIDYMPYEI